MKTVNVNGVVLTEEVTDALLSIQEKEFGHYCIGVLQKTIRMLISYAQAIDVDFSSKEVLFTLGQLNDMQNLFNSLTATGKASNDE